MKKSKLRMIATIVAITVLSISFALDANAKEEKKVRKVAVKEANLTYDQAMQNSHIVQAMYEQIIDDFTHLNWAYYTAQIKYHGSRLFIQGSYVQWYFFFKDQIKYKREHMQ